MTCTKRVVFMGKKGVVSIPAKFLVQSVLHASLKQEKLYKEYWNV